MTTTTYKYNASAAAGEEWEHRVSIVREYYASKGYRVHSGLQFGCELVLYADDPSLVHSDFCVSVVPLDGRLDWKQLQTLVRSMSALHKTLIVANVVVVAEQEHEQQLQQQSAKNDIDDDRKGNNNGSSNSGVIMNAEDGSSVRSRYVVQELSMVTEHAPFRHLRKKQQQQQEQQEPGTQRKNMKRPKIDARSSDGHVQERSND